MESSFLITWSIFSKIPQQTPIKLAHQSEIKGVLEISKSDQFLCFLSCNIRLFRPYYNETGLRTVQRYCHQNHVKTYTTMQHYHILSKHLMFRTEKKSSQPSLVTVTGPLVDLFLISRHSTETVECLEIKKQVYRRTSYSDQANSPKIMSWRTDLREINGKCVLQWTVPLYSA